MSESCTHGRALEKALLEENMPTDSLENALYHRDTILATMKALREAVDEMEIRCDAKKWPYPGYGEILFSVK